MYAPPFGTSPLPSGSEDDTGRLLETLPPPVRDAARRRALPDLVEVVLDLGRSPEAWLPGHREALGDAPVTRDDLDYVLARVGAFSADNRAGIEATLHRVSLLRNRRGDPVGLTLRVGRAVRGAVDLVRDLVESGRSLLLVGKPGVGKTTMLRETARVLADDLGRRVMVVDTSNEIAGDGDVPHPGIGRARRLQVPHPEQQHAVMIEAVENHTPEAVVVDEIGTLAEAVAARTIAERGVQLVATAHGNTLANLVANPTLADLVGGVQAVTLGDDEARLRGSQKTVNERKAPPTFDTVVEIVGHREVVVHRDTAAAVDALLRGHPTVGERRVREPDGTVVREAMPPAAPLPRPSAASSAGAGVPRERKRIYPYAVTRDSVERVIRDLDLDARVSERPQQADVILALRSRGEDARLARILRETGAAVHWVKRNSTAHIRRVLAAAFHVVGGVDQEEAADAVDEASRAVLRVRTSGVAVELGPRRPALRRLQHQRITGDGLASHSVGREPRRRLVVEPDSPAVEPHGDAAAVGVEHHPLRDDLEDHRPLRAEAVPFPHDPPLDEDEAP